MSPAEYVKLFLAAYKGIKAGDPNAVVAAGETSNRGLNRPTRPRRRIRLGRSGDLRGAASRRWTRSFRSSPGRRTPTRPSPRLGPTQKVAFPNVAFSTMTEFGESLQKWFGRRIPIWITEYGEQTVPQYRFGGVSYAQQAADVREALHLAESEPLRADVHLVRSSATARRRPGSAASSSRAERRSPRTPRSPRPQPALVGQSQTITPGHPFDVTLPVPFIAWHDPAGSTLGLTYALKRGSLTLLTGRPQVTLTRQDMVTFRVNFRPVKNQIYSLTVRVEDIHGQSESHVIALIPASS